MTSADPGRGDPADPSVSPRRLSPPPPQYDASDEISLDDPVPLETEPEEPQPVPRPTLKGSGPDPVADPTAPGVRVGGPFRMFWFWFAPNSSVLGLVVGAALFSFGMSVRQVAVSALVGVAITAALLAIGVLRGRNTGLVAELDWPGVFGPLGARIVSALGLVVRIGWGSVLLWVFAAVVSGPESSSTALIVVLIVGALVAGTAAVIGYRAIAVSAAVTTVASAVLIVALIAVDVRQVDVPVALGIGDGSAESILGGIVIVFSITALTVLPSSTSIGRYQGAGSASSHALSASLGLAVPVIALLVSGALLAGGDPDLATRLLSSPVAGLAGLAPPWAELVIACLGGVGLLVTVALTIYSGGFALQGVGVRLGRGASTGVVAATTVLAAIPFTVASPDGTIVLRDIVTTLAVPVAAVSGVMTTRAILRRFRRSGRPRPGTGRIRWSGLGVVVLAMAAGFGLTSAGANWLSWQGYLFWSDAGSIATSDPGVLVALLAGGLVAFTGTRRRQRRGARGSHRDDRTAPADQ